MKLKHLFLKSVCVLQMSLSPLIFCTTSCANDQPVPDITSVVRKHADVYSIRQNGVGDLVYAKEDMSRFFMDITGDYVYEFNNLPMAYLSVDDYVRYCMDFTKIGSIDDQDFYDIATYTSTTKNYQTVITSNIEWKGIVPQCVIDYRKQTLTFNDYDLFCQMAARKEKTLCPINNGMVSVEYTKVISDNYVSGGEFVIDLHKYNIPIFYYENKGYMTMEILQHIINGRPVSNFFYDGNNFLQVLPQPATKDDSWCAPQQVKLYEYVYNHATNLNHEWMEYIYNWSALMLDMNFCNKDRESRITKGKICKFMPNGAYAALEPYHDRLTSLESFDSSEQAWIDFARTQLDDGGHTIYRAIDLLSRDTTRDPKSSRGIENLRTGDTRDRLQEMREDLEWDPISTIMRQNNLSEEYVEFYDPSTYFSIIEKKDGDWDPTHTPVGYFCFDAFDDERGYVDEEVDAKRYLEKLTDENNYWRNMTRAIIYINSVLHKEDNQIKDLVIDMSCNGGGLVWQRNFLCNWLCPNFVSKLYNGVTGSYDELKQDCDVNGDGLYDDYDHIPEGIHIWLLLSNSSFSSANATACGINDAIDKNRNPLTILGDYSGGGSCAVGSINIGFGNLLRIGGTRQLIRGYSTIDNPVSNEAGAGPEIPECYFPIWDLNPETGNWDIPNEENARKYCDRIGMTQWIWDMNKEMKLC